MEIFMCLLVGVIIGIWAIIAGLIIKYAVDCGMYNMQLSQLDDDYCMCGDLFESHSFGSGHSPVGQKEYYMSEKFRPKYE